MRNAEHHRLLRAARGHRVRLFGRPGPDFPPGAGAGRPGRRWRSAEGLRGAGPANPETGAGIVSFRKDGLDSRLVVSRLKERGMLAAPRQGWVRMSPHFYISSEEIAQVSTRCRKSPLNTALLAD